MDIKVNVLELASELAHKDLVEMVGDENKLFEDPTAGITVYTEHAQDKFNELYDYYYDVILNCKL
jgi:hypothetical protein